MQWRRGWSNPHNAPVLTKSMDKRARETRLDRDRTPLELFTKANGIDQIGSFKMAKIFHAGSKGKVRTAKKDMYLKLRTMPLPQKFITDDPGARQSPTARGLLAADWRQCREMVAASTLSGISGDHYESPWAKADAGGTSRYHLTASSMYNQVGMAPLFGEDQIDQAAIRVRADVLNTHLPFTNSSLCGPNNAPYSSVRELTYFGLALQQSSDPLHQPHLDPSASRDDGILIASSSVSEEWRMQQADPREQIRGCAFPRGTDLPNYARSGQYLCAAHGMRAGAAAVCGGYGPSIVSWLASGDLQPKSAIHHHNALSPRDRTLLVEVRDTTDTSNAPPRLHPAGGYFMDFGRRWRRFALYQGGDINSYYVLPTPSSSSSEGGSSNGTPRSLGDGGYFIPSLMGSSSLEVRMSSTPSAAISRAHQFVSTLSPSIVLGLPAPALRYLVETVAAVGCPGMKGTDAALILAVTEQWHEFNTSPLQQLELLRCMSVIASTYASQVVGFSGAGRVVTGDHLPATISSNPNESLRSTITRFLVFSAELFPPKLWQTLPTLLKYFGARGLMLEVLELLDLAMLWVGDTIPTSYHALLETVGRQPTDDGPTDLSDHRTSVELLSFFPNTVSGACEASAPFAYFKETCGLGKSHRSCHALTSALRSTSTNDHDSTYVAAECVAAVRAQEVGSQWWDAAQVSLNCFQQIRRRNGDRSSTTTDVPLLRGGVQLMKVTSEVVGGMWNLRGATPGAAPIPLGRRADSVEWAVTLMTTMVGVVTSASPITNVQMDDSRSSQYHLPHFGVFTDILAEVSLLAESLGVASKLVLTSSIGKGARDVVKNDISLRQERNQRYIGSKGGLAAANMQPPRVDLVVVPSISSKGIQRVGPPPVIANPMNAVTNSLETGAPLPRLRRASTTNSTDTSQDTSLVATPTSALQCRVNPFQRSTPELHSQLVRTLFEDAVPLAIHLGALCAERLVPTWRGVNTTTGTNAFYTSNAKWDDELLQGAIDALQTIEELWELAIYEGLGSGASSTQHHHLLIHPSDLNTIAGVLHFLQRCVGSQLAASQEQQ